MAVHIHPRPAAPTPAPKAHGPALPEHDITVNGSVITARDVAAEMQHHPADSADAAWDAAARALVVRRLLLDAAAEAGTAAANEAEEDAAISALLAAEIRIPTPDEAACRRWLAAHPERFGRPEAWEASHILIAADPEVPEERVGAEARARDLLTQITAAPWRLAELARRHSDCPSREEGGDLGRIARGSTVPEFEAALAGAAAGGILPEPVPTRYGLHVVQVHRHIPAQAVAFEDVAKEVARDLVRASWEAAARQFLAVLASRAKIEGYAFDGVASGPLVQ
ncbi:peptidylprolyl isomerase [Falsiroseomonas sp. HW251]|uniref:peptidylprolyl isomerase n=1 Tax=Falsiroseomonas sp. HW251 TaxID=3390998 RepID=UPI003D321036